jgi:hypothetical protein
MSTGSPLRKRGTSAPDGAKLARMLWPLARSKAGRISSVAALTAVDMKALISADRA